MYIYYKIYRINATWAHIRRVTYEKHKGQQTNTSEKLPQMDSERLAACADVCPCLCRHALRCFRH